MMTKTLSALTLVAGLAFSGIGLADPPGGAPAKPATTSSAPHKAHGPKLKQVSKKGDAAQPGADKASAPAAVPAK